MLKYIVTKRNDLYQLCATYKVKGHAGMVADMKQRQIVHPNAEIAGGGFLGIAADPERSVTGVVLNLESASLGAEPPHVRTALRPVILAKLQELGFDTSKTV